MEDKYFDEIDKEAIDTLFKEMDVKIDKKLIRFTTTLRNLLYLISLKTVLYASQTSTD